MHSSSKHVVTHHAAAVKSCGLESERVCSNYRLAAIVLSLFVVGMHIARAILLCWRTAL